MTLAAPRRVTVVAPHVRVDVSLPPQSTVVELLPQLVRMCNAHSDQAGAVAGWELSRLGAPPLELALTVESAGVRDGELLYLLPREHRPPPPVFDDVVDAIASAAAGHRWAWRPAVSRRVGLAGSALAFAAVGVLWGFFGPPGAATPVLAGGLAVLLLVAGGALSRAYGDAGAGAALAAAGLPSVMVAGAHLIGTRIDLLHPSATQFAVACGALTAYSVLAVAIVVAQSAWFIGVAAAATIGALTTVVVMLTGARPEPAAAVVAVAMVALSPALPTLALRLGGLPLPRVPTDVAAFRRDERPTPGPAVADDTATAERLLAGLLGAVGAVVLFCVAFLLGWHSSPAWLLAALVGLALVLRARAFLSLPARLAPLLAGCAVLAATAVRVAGQGGATTRMVIALVAIVVGVACGSYAIRAPYRSLSPYWSRLVDVAELVTLIALVPVCGAVVGLYTAVRGWVS